MIVTIVVSAATMVTAAFAWLSGENMALIHRLPWPSPACEKIGFGLKAKKKKKCTF